MSERQDTPRRILLHVCCAPCAVHPVARLREAGFEVTGLFYNPNIHPASEYIRRRDTLASFASQIGLDRVIWKDEGWDPKAWMRAVAYREESRCLHCYAMRLEQTLFVAKRGRFDAFSSTMLYSRHMKHDLLRELGRDMAGGGSPVFHYEDFREGWKQGIEESKRLGMYRQDYCGCLLSEAERRAGQVSPKGPRRTPGSDA